MKPRGVVLVAESPMSGKKVYWVDGEGWSELRVLATIWMVPEHYRIAKDRIEDAKRYSSPSWGGKFPENVGLEDH